MSRNPTSSTTRSDPAELSLETIRKIMTEGLREGHKRDAWRSEPADNHLDKALRHALTYRLMRDGNSPDPDAGGEDRLDHLRRALCRIAFVLVQEKDSGKKKRAVAKKKKK
jgi:hypothetical protein